MSKRPQNVSNLLAEVFSRRGIKRGIRRAEAVLLWPQVVGREATKFSKAASFRDGILLVDVPDGETATHLGMQRQKFLDVYHVRFGIKELQDIRFRTVTRVAAPAPAEARLPEVPADPKALARIARQLSTKALPDDLAGTTMAAARALLSRRARLYAAGHRPCPTCEVMTEHTPLCPTCTRYTRDPLVRRAAEQLSVAPDAAPPNLGEDERAVARYLAVEQLKDTLGELLPQVLGSPALKPQLESAARCFLAHTLNKPLGEIDDDDLGWLEPRIARVLGRWG
ncbi:MAG: DUF721 domain-containing protein [Trueperaceae bacterium]|nr:DUF721 domain-containing protein [Trueperaceae bacterium]